MINISYFFYLAKCFGLAPYSLSPADSKPNRLCKIIWRVPTFLMIFFYSVFVCSIFWKCKATSEISNTANWIQFIPNSLIFFIVLVSAECSRYTIQAVGQLIHELDQKLKLFQISFSNSQRRIKRLSIFAAFLVICCGSNISILHYVIGVNPAQLVSIFYWLAFTVGKVGLLTFNFMFSLYMMVLLERLRIVAKIIEWMNEMPANRKLIVTKEFKDMRRSNTLSNVIMPPPNSAEFIDNIHDIVEKLQKICSKMNSYFGKKVIFTILSAFICLTVQLFYLINNIRRGFPNDKSVLAATASCSLIFTHIMEIWIIFISGHRVKDSWSSLIKQVQSVKRRYVGDENFKVRIDELVSIMIFTRVELKAAGLFNIDLSVITSIVSSIATYLVVLVQFKMSEEDVRNGTLYHDDLQQFSNQVSQGKNTFMKP